MNSQLQTEFPDRIATLCDGRSGLRGGIHVEVREPDHSTPDTRHSSPSPAGEAGTSSSHSSPEIRDNSCNSCLDFTASDESLDRYDEIIAASGWKLGNYQRNPVFQNAHKYGDIIFTLGKSLVTEVRGGKLFQRIQFATDVNPMAKIAYGLYKGKFLNAVSVGFIPLKWENGDGVGQSSFASPSPGGEGRGEGGLVSTVARHSTPQRFRRRYLEQELLEVSAVGIPANPNALQLGLKAGAIEKCDLRDLSDLIRHALDQPKAGAAFPSPGGEGQGEGETSLSHSPPHPLTHSHLAQLARQLHAILKS